MYFRQECFTKIEENSLNVEQVHSSQVKFAVPVLADVKGEMQSKNNPDESVEEMGLVHHVESDQGQFCIFLQDSDDSRSSFSLYPVSPGTDGASWFGGKMQDEDDDYFYGEDDVDFSKSRCATPEGDGYYCMLSQS